MATKLFVGKLSYDTTNDSLQAAFAQHGNVISAQVITDRGTNQSKGFGFVEMSSEAEANKAIELFHDQDFQGRRLTVNIARPLAPREDRPRRAF